MGWPCRKNGYKAFVSHLGQVAMKNSGQSATQSKAKSLMKLLRSKDVMTFVHFLSDVVAILAKLSCALQKRNTCLYEVHQEFTTTVSNIEKLHNRPGPELRFFISCGNEFEGELPTGNADNFAPQKSRVITSLTESMNNRFKDLDVGVMQSTKIADLAKWPATNEEAIDDHVATLVDHYRNTLIRHDVDVTCVEAEWTKLGTSSYENHKVHELSWSTVIDRYESDCHNILKVVDLVLSLPAGTSECERGFSQMRILKNQWRNKLRSTSMTLLMTIQLHSSNIDKFDPFPAIHQWWTSGSRRPNFMEKRKKKKTVVDEIDEIIEIEQNQQDVRHDEHDEAEEFPEKQHPDSDYDSNFSDLDTDDDDSEPEINDFEF